MALDLQQKSISLFHGGQLTISTQLKNPFLSSSILFSSSINCHETVMQEHEIVLLFFSEKVNIFWN